MASNSVNGGALDEMRFFGIELFTLLGIVVGITGLRLCLRTYTVGVRRLRLDDGLALVGAVFYVFKTVLAYMLDTRVHWLANHSISEAHRAVLQPSDPEYQLRELGSKLYLFDWVSYSAVLWTLKAALCTYLLHQYSDFERRQQLYVYLGFGFISVSWFATSLTLLQSCRPLWHMWQISPDPNPYCQPADSPALVWTFFSFDMATNLCLAVMAMHALFGNTNKTISESLWSLAPVGCGLFVMMASVARAVLLVSDRIDAVQMAGSWAVWQAFAAVVVVNAPVLFSCFKGMSSSNGGSRSSNLSINGGSGIWRPTGQSSYQSSRFSVAGTSYINSEERIPGTPNKEADLDAESGIISSEMNSGECRNSGIQRMVEVTVLEECLLRPQRGPCETCGNYTRSWSNEAVVKPEQRSDYFSGHVHYHNSHSSNLCDHWCNSR